MKSKVIVVQVKEPYQMVQKGRIFFAKPSKQNIFFKPNLIVAETTSTTTPCETKGTGYNDLL